MTGQLPTESLGYEFTQCGIRQMWVDGWTGAGQIVGIVDEGLSSADLALLRNDTSLDFDLVDNDNIPEDDSTTTHGQKVFNVLTAQADGTGAVGVAYDSLFFAIRVAYGAGGSPFMFSSAVSLAGKRGGGVNCSWGYSVAFQDNFIYDPAALQALKDATTLGRAGKGSNVIFSSGNDRQAGSNTAFHGWASSGRTICVAGVDSTGKVSYFSTPGLSVLVAASANGIQYAGYGTSFAAPIVTGIVAAMQEANPNLRWYEVPEILALAATKTGNDQAAWVKNAIGRDFSRDVGFGIVNGARSCAIARRWQPLDLIEIEVTGTDQAAVDRDITIFNIEIECAPAPHMAIQSAAGTLAELFPAFPAGIVAPDRFLTGAEIFRGESSKGLWKIPGPFVLRISGASGYNPLKYLGPYIVNQISEIQTMQYQSFSKQIDPASFADPEGGALTYALSMADGSPLPAWLKFDPATLTLSGAPDALGTFALTLTATDPGGESASQNFNLIVDHANLPPQIMKQIPDIQVEV